ncbi:MAG: manganese catalase family protein [Acidobacteriota bacterium]
MFLRIDKLQIELPQSPEPDPQAAANVQELLGGRFGEMSTLMNYMYQSFNFRNRESLRPYYELIANIATEELGHIELVSASINSLLNGPRREFDSTNPADSPFGNLPAGYNPHHFIATGQATLVGNSLGQPWRGDYVYSSGNLILDLLHNFFLENGARTNKLRVYEMTKNPAAREMLGYLFVRGGVHALAYAKALETLTGVDMKKMLPIPKIPNSHFAEARKFEAQGSHRRLYRFSPNDYRDMARIWSGNHPEDNRPLEVVDGPPAGGNLAQLAGIASSFAPEYQPEEILEMANKLYQHATS